MNLHDRAIALLRCPFCAAPISVKWTLRAGPDGGMQHGLLECRDCHFDYPVVDGIAILMAPHQSVDTKVEVNSVTLLDGPRVSDVSGAISSGQPTRAMSLLFNPTELAGNWFPPLGPPSVALSAREPHRKAGGSANPVKRVLERANSRGRPLLAKYLLPQARMRLADFLLSSQESLSAIDVMDLYYRQFSGVETFHYFAYRFGQPRHLAALALASLLDDTSGPVLDLACGAGHMTHYLSRVRLDRVVIGADRDFVRLWIAHRFVAPSAVYVCASADQPFPFADGAFHGVFCSDAFHYFLQRAAAVREMLRALAPEGALVAARFGNVELEPREGYELTVDGYARLLGDMPHRFAGEDRLVLTYLARRRADLEVAETAQELARQKWISLVAGRRTDLFRRGDAPGEFAHTVGRLQINPIYRIDARQADGSLTLCFDFPSDWYKFENDGYRDYAPERVVLPGRLVEALQRGERPPELEPYIRQFVVIGMPSRYCERPRARVAARKTPRVRDGLLGRAS